MNDSVASGPASREVYIRLFNQEMDAFIARLREAGMPGIGICGCLASHYAYLAHQTGGTEQHAREVVSEALRRVFTRTGGAAS
jgi:hypothetical protein